MKIFIILLCGLFLLGSACYGAETYWRTGLQQSDVEDTQQETYWITGTMYYKITADGAPPAGRTRRFF